MKRNEEHLTGFCGVASKEEMFMSSPKRHLILKNDSEKNLYRKVKGL